MVKKLSEDFILMSRIIVVATENHQLYPQLQRLPNFFTYKKSLTIENADIIFDFTLLDDEEKARFCQQHQNKIFSDLTLYNTNQIKARGAFSTVFPSPNNKFEWYGKNEDETIVKTFFEQLKLTPIKISELPLGFIFPRILVQIINEAYFAMEEKVAEEKDIDTAMLFGVNYPKGPIAWGKSAGLKNVIHLLELLYAETNNPRYKICELLKNHGSH